MTEINEVPQSEPLPPEGDLAQRSFIMDALAAAAGTAGGEAVLKGVVAGMPHVARLISPPPGKHAAGPEPLPADADRDDG